MDNNFQQILSIWEREEDECLAYKAEINSHFKLTPEILSTILITLCDTCSWSVPEQHLAQFEQETLELFKKNYLTRFDGKNLDYSVE